ncbi:hemicentin-1-like [Anopheles aquasalis]|uniref:hemicentin-1-like n=1 Tax=Anopheles aquasalis TaxID=42839 RepID=UPI00215B0F22|nr:hemicentin-1-like [Anopheles aquasalis]
MHPLGGYVLGCGQLLLIISAIDGKSMNEKDSKHEVFNVDGVEGRNIELQCPITVPLSQVYMVLWFKDNAGIPLYSVDVRDKVSRQPAHWSAPEVFGSRAKFNIDKSPASLLIKNLKRHDQGIYRCRIDFRTIQTQTYRYNLSVIVLPEQPVVLDRWGRHINGTKLGPKEEGDDVVITCRVSGGRPQPEVRWLINGVIVDDQYEQNSGDVIENRLLWPTIQRSDLNSIFTCQTMNTKLVEAKETSYVLDMHLKPLAVKVINAPSTLVADKRYEISCQSMGSRPNAIITWYKGKRQMRRTKDEILDHNTTVSVLSFVPTTEDDGKTLTCRAENPNVNGLFLETDWKMNVVYPPMVTIQFGPTLVVDDIKEGDDVYFECHVRANPDWKKLQWFHNDILLQFNASARIIQSGQSLVLQKVTKQSAGNYACSAINAEGETVSDQQLLRVKHVPVCATDKLSGNGAGNGSDVGGGRSTSTSSSILIGASRNENVEIPCHIFADPPARSFHWRFNNSAEIVQVDSHRYTSQGNVSVLSYSPVTDQDFGTLTCWAVNEVGPQSQPCTFQLVLADLPAPVSNCTLLPNRTQQLVEIQCVAGYDGGLPQMFVLELISKRTGTRRFNFSNKNEPYFVLDRLEKLSALMTLENNSLSAMVTALNQKGRSTPVLLQDFEIGRIQSYRGAPAEERVEATVLLEWLPIAVGILLTVLILALSISTKSYLARCCGGGWMLRTGRHRDDDSKRDELSKADGGLHTKNALLLADEYECGTTHCLKLKNVQMLRRHSSRKKNTTKDSNDDEPEPDVIPAQFNLVSSSPLLATPQHNDITTRLKDTRYDGSVSTEPYQSSAVATGEGGVEAVTSLGGYHQGHHHQPVLTMDSGGIGSAPDPVPLEYRSQGSIVGILPTGGKPLASSSELDLNVIKDRLLTTRVPESCV